MLELFHEISKNLAHSFTKHLKWHIIAIFLTFFCVFTGFDWYYSVHTQGASIQTFLFPGVIIGGIGPIILPIVLLLAGKILNKRKTINTGFAVAQAAFLGWLISSIYKAFTGRVPPPFRNLADIDTSHVFNFGFFKYGIFWGWPSSHTTVAFAIAVTIFMLYQKNKFIKYFAILGALYVGIGVSVNVHWFSDFLAGLIIGSVIGITVGKSFRSLYHKHDNL